MKDKSSKKFPLNKHIQLTKKGLDGLRVQLNQLRKEQMALCKRLLNMDLREKEDYMKSTNVGGRLEVIDTEVAKISNILQRADVIFNKKSRSNIGLGSTVFLESERKMVNYTLVSSIEADPSANKISDDSPLGKALLGKKESETISVASPRGKRFLYRVLAIK